MWCRTSKGRAFSRIIIVTAIYSIHVYLEITFETSRSLWFTFILSSETIPLCSSFHSAHPETLSPVSAFDYHSTSSTWHSSVSGENLSLYLERLLILSSRASLCSGVSAPSVSCVWKLTRSNLANLCCSLSAANLLLSLERFRFPWNVFAVVLFLFAPQSLQVFSLYPSLFSFLTALPFQSQFLKHKELFLSLVYAEVCSHLKHSGKVAQKRYT